MNAADYIGHRIWQGSAPKTLGQQVALHRNFEVLVLCAQEFQPRAHLFPYMKVVHAGIDDAGTPVTRAELETANDAAEAAAYYASEGLRVLVTCWQGINRSGLVSALALHKLTGASGEACIKRVQERRPGALTNPWFVETLSEIPARRKRVAAPNRRRVKS